MPQPRGLSNNPYPQIPIPRNHIYFLKVHSNIVLSFVPHRISGGGGENLRKLKKKIVEFLFSADAMQVFFVFICLYIPLYMCECVPTRHLTSGFHKPQSQFIYIYVDGRTIEWTLKRQVGPSMLGIQLIWLRIAIIGELL